MLRYIFAFDENSPLLFTQFYFWAFFAIVYALFALIVEVGRPADRTQRARLHMRNVFLMAVSWFFYYKTSGLFLLILLFVTLSDWLIAQQIHRHSGLKARLWLTLSVIIDLSLLAYFKYAYFFTDVFNSAFGTSVEVFDIFAYVGNGLSRDGRFLVDTIILPVGISFYTFQVISYTVDVYRGLVKPVSNLLDFGFYVSFFPQLVAGPIVRAKDFIPQLYRPFFLGKRQFGIALFWILNGLSKKIILSDYLAVNFIDRVFNNPMLFSGFENLFALFTYSVQVYADFSGYTDIAIGVAMLMGFYLPQNFDSPYKSRDPQEFWRRWHMSLSAWLKAYVYIPLGGNRTLLLLPKRLKSLTANSQSGQPSSRSKLLYSNINSFLTMLIGGLWHGASWNFVIWGGLNGLGMIVAKVWKAMSWHVRFAAITCVTFFVTIADYLDPTPALNMAMVWLGILWVACLVRYINHLITYRDTTDAGGWMDRWYRLTDYIGQAWAIVQTFVFISFTRLFFRAASNLDPATANEEAWRTARQMVTQIGGAWNNAIIPDFLHEYRVVVTLFVLGMIIHWLPARFKRWYRLRFALLPIWAMLIIVVVTVFVVYQFVTADLQPFIYFQF